MPRNEAKKGYYLILATLSLALLFPGTILAGFGVSPAKIVEDRLVKGSVFERVFYFVQGTPDKDLAVVVEVDDTDIKDWISIEPAGAVTIPKGTQQFPVTITIRVPKDAKLGIYKAYIRATGVPAGSLDPSKGSGVSIVVGARADIELTVGEGVYYQYAIRDIDLKNIKETQQPMASISVDNTGNVPAGPAEANFELFNKYGDVRIAYVQGIKIEPTEPFTDGTKIVEFPISVGLSVGEYWGLVKLYNDNGDMVREFKDIFNVEKATFMDKHWRQIAVGGGVLILLFLWIVARKLRRRK